MNTSDDKPIGRCLRSGLKPNFRPQIPPKSRRKDKTDSICGKNKTRLKIPKNLAADNKLFKSKPVVVINRLKPNLIKKYDKIYFNKYSKLLKREEALNKYSKIRQILVNSHTKQSKITANNESPKRMLLWTSPISQSKQHINYPILRSHVKRLAKYDERENSLMSLPEFCRNLNLISRKDMKRMNTKQMKTSFSLRHIAKSEDYSVNQLNQIEINYEYLIGSVDSNQKSNTNQNSNITKKKKKKNIWTVSKVKEKYNKLEKQKYRLTELWKRQYLSCLSSFDVSSPMGQRVFSSLKAPKLETKKVESYVKRYDSYCYTNKRLRNIGIENELNKWKVQRIERLTTAQELSQRSRALDCHQYSFTRRQRLEKCLRLKTGINWKSRLRALNCSSKIEILLKKIKWCPFCENYIEVNHNCDNDSASDCESRSVSAKGLNPNNVSNVSSNQRVLRHQKRSIIEENRGKDKIKCKISPKTRNSIKKAAPRVCQIDLDQSFKNNTKIEIDLDEQSITYP